MPKLSTVLGAVALVAITSAVAAGPAAACNARGEFCSYPTWAANAFSAPRDRAPVYAILPTTTPSKASTGSTHKRRK